MMKAIITETIPEEITILRAQIVPIIATQALRVSQILTMVTGK